MWHCYLSLIVTENCEGTPMPTSSVHDCNAFYHFHILYIHVCMYVCVFVYTYISTHTQTHHTVFFGNKQYCTKHRREIRNSKRKKLKTWECKYWKMPRNIFSGESGVCEYTENPRVHLKHSQMGMWPMHVQWSGTE